MSEIAIIIPSRLAAERLPNKPLKLIDNKEMILHVYEAAKKTGSDLVCVATPDIEIVDLIKKNGGDAYLTQKNHETGTDRVFEVFEKKFQKKPNIIINLQGDMPNIESSSIESIANYMKKNLCDIATLASEIKEKEKTNPNVVKVKSNTQIDRGEFGQALDFFRTTIDLKDSKTYHHVGIYGFTNKALIRYVGLERSRLEIERKLEQLRALENNMKIDVGFIKTSPLSVDTEEDLKNIKKLMEKNEK